MALPELEGEELVPVAIDGLSSQVLEMRVNPQEHPRL
ncbi:hypothetical protein tinsulaeT_38470 [Thalassotalea insulae]|uniref:Uncharacterized protein n=1 Tax=Thalassotalea insulae TaxID=2056778 RepID=A0ABQ6H113_9GAMM|nr:hypothetical protein tinsulaeT_38470 [Thalassotalea insulae]